MAQLRLLNNSAIRSALQQAWKDLKPGITGGHEEGGFIVGDMAGNVEVVRWHGGEQGSIRLPPHPNCKIGSKDIIATFHTHPNTGEDYLQEPSETDKRAVRDDPGLKGKFYEGEIVISKEKIYLIEPDGLVSEVADTRKILLEA